MTIEVRERQPEAAPAVSVPEAGDGLLDVAPGVPLHAGMGLMELAPAVAVPQKKTWREQRQQRRRRRIWFEEAVAWIVVPVIVFGCYYLVEATLNALGTSVSAIMDGIGLLLSVL
jgi:hypothetical protein